MTTNAAIGYGSAFAVESAAASGVYTTLAEVTDITPPSESVDVIDVTHMASPDSTREFIQGLMDPGEVSLEMNFEPSSATDDFIRAWRSSRETRSCKITFPNSVTWIFDGFVTGYEPTIPLEDKMTATLTCKVTSSVVSS